MEENRISDRAKLLLIDNDEESAGFVRRMAKQGQYKVSIAEKGRSGMEIATGICPDVVLLDLQLPDMDGMEFIRWFRQWNSCPVLVISKKSAPADKVNALYAGADDYIMKPFCREEVEARIYTALRRRVGKNQEPCYEAEGLKIDFSRRQVTLQGTQVHFSPVEYRILECLALNSGAVVTYQMLLEKIWGPYMEYNSRILRVNMTNIRKKIEKMPMHPIYITTIPRVGYRMLESHG